MRRNGLISLVFIVLLAGGSLGYTFASGNEPLLGLDLQGGISVVLEPAEEASGDAIGQAIDIIRNRIDGLGVAEPEIARQGDAIVVQVPGVKDRERVLELVGQTAELQFRPVLQVLNYIDPDAPPEDGGADTTSTTVVDDGTTDTTAGDGETDTDTTAPDAEDEPADDGSSPETTVPNDDDTTTTTGDEETGMAPISLGESALPAFQSDDETTTTTSAEEDSTTTDPDGETSPSAGGDDFLPPEDLVDPATLTAGEDDSETSTLVADKDKQFSLIVGPVAATGEILSSADARLENLGQWQVAVSIKSSGLSQFNEISASCFNQDPVICPTGQLAIVLDGQVQSFPSINAPAFDSSGVSITGNFSESEAKELALVLRYGSLPVELIAQETRSVSASIGKDALDSGVIAGLVGLALVALYMTVYYRLLGLVAVLSIGVSASLLWSVVAYLGEKQGLALTLAGVTGIIVSIGVAVDSNVVFYEHLKEDVSKGRTLRSAIDGSFTSAFSTIVKADIASLIGAGVLWFLTVGPVRGFAFYLGLSTILDLVSSYFFMRPLASILVRSKALQDRPRVFGMPALATSAEVAS